MAASFAFEGFVLDPADRRLSAAATRSKSMRAISTRWRCWSGEQGRLVTKDRFLDEVWRRRAGHRRSADPVHQDAPPAARRRRGEPALHRDRAQAWLSLHRRRSKSWTAARLRRAARSHAPATLAASSPSPSPGTLGGGVAGAIGGLFYGFVGASQPAPQGVGALVDPAGAARRDDAGRADRRRRASASASPPPAIRPRCAGAGASPAARPAG